MRGGWLVQMVDVRVPNLDCEGCAAKIRRALFKLKGKLNAANQFNSPILPPLI